MSFTGSLFALAWALAVMFPFPFSLLAFAVFGAAVSPLAVLTIPLDALALLA